MKEILDQIVPETSLYADGRLRGVSLRAISRHQRLLGNLLKDPSFRLHHRDLFYDLEFIRQLPSIYGRAGLRAPKRRR